MNFSKRVIILNNVKSPDIAQAIFILRDTSCDDFSAVNEAERIVDEFLFSASRPKRGVKKAVFTLCAVVFCVFVGLFFALR